MGDLERGVSDALADVEAVERAETLAVTGVTPRATDIRVTATVRVVLADHTADPAAVRDTVEAAVGVFTADPVDVGPVEA